MTMVEPMVCFTCEKGIRGSYVLDNPCEHYDGPTGCFTTTFHPDCLTLMRAEPWRLFVRLRDILIDVWVDDVDRRP
jgi:hypothetical protein